tara:strand:+ start:620 stop:796 length:177 start_codon:yes stop_codon:yes gene_type:complete
MEFATLRAMAKIDVSNLFGIIQFDEHWSVARAIVAVPIAQTVWAAGWFDLDHPCASAG